ncbi:unnamed protein product, partial [Allacma fusca]
LQNAHCLCQQGTPVPEDRQELL